MSAPATTFGRPFVALYAALVLLAGPCGPELASRHARPKARTLLVAAGASIQAAVDSARYGDTVLVVAGVYREHVVARSGVSIVGQPGAILDGTDARLVLAWAPAGDSLWRAPLGEPYFYTNHNIPLVWRDSLAFYRYPSAADCSTGVAHTPYWAVPVAEGWWSYSDAWPITLTVRSDDPTRHVWHVCPWAEGFYLRQVDDVLIRGFTVRYFRFGVFMAGCQRVSIEDCTFLTPFGIRAGNAPMTEVDGADPPRASRDNAISRCVFRSPPAMTYQATKGTWQETAAISASGSRWSIGACDVSLNHDGIQCEADSSLIQSNWVHDLSDDGIELDGEGREVVVRGNRIERTNNAISLAPITVGLTTVERDTIGAVSEQAFKMDPWDSVRVRFKANVVQQP